MAEDLKNRADHRTPQARAKARDEEGFEDQELNEEEPEDEALALLEMDAQDAPEKPKDNAKETASESGLKDDTLTTALLLYAMYAAAKGLGKGDAPKELDGAVEKIKDTVSLYTGKKPEKLTVMPEENGMRVAVDQSGRPVWATVKNGADPNQNLIFDWRQDGGLSITLDGPKGFEGRISSRGKIELSKDNKSVVSADNHWITTYPDGSVAKWQGKLNFKPGAKSFNWAAGNSNERSEPLKYTTEHQADNRKADGLITESLERMTSGAVVENAFTSRERAQMKALYGSLMNGDLPAMEAALQDINQKTKSEIRVNQILGHFIAETGLKNSLSISWTSGGASLAFKEGEGNRLVISGNSTQKSFSHADVNTPKLPAHDTFIDLVRSERVARRELSEKQSLAANGRSEEIAKADTAKRTLLNQSANRGELADPQKNVLRELESRFLRGDINGLKRVIQSYDGKPSELAPILKAFGADMGRYTKDFESNYTVSGNDVKVGTLTLGDANSKIVISTEAGAPAFAASDSQPELRRSANELGADLSRNIIRDAIKVQLVEVPEDPRTPMTGLRDSRGVWHPNYLDALSPEARAQLEERISRQYFLGGHDEMVEFAMRAGRRESEWKQTDEKYRAGLSEEMQAFYDLERASDAFRKTRDATLKAIGLDQLPQRTTIADLQMSTSALVGFLKSDQAKAVKIADTAEKVKILEDYQIARQTYFNSGRTLDTKYEAFEKIKDDFFSELSNNAPLPAGMTKQQVMNVPVIMKEYLQNIDTTLSGIKNSQEKIKIIDDYLAAQAELQSVTKSLLEPAEKKYFTVRDEVLTKLGADKVPSGMTDVAIKENAEILREFLKLQGKALGLDNLAEKIQSTETFIANQKRHADASLKNNALFEERRRQLETVTNDLAKAIGLPPIKLEIANWTKNALGDYLDGRIRINRQHLAERMDSSVAGTVYHELVHAEQQFKMVRLVADQFVASEQREPTASELAKAYKDRLGFSVDKDYAEACLTARERKVLNPQEAEMAGKLIAAWQKNGSVDGNFSQSADAYHQLAKVGEDVATYLPAEKLIDAYLNGTKSFDIDSILPGSGFQAGPNKEKARRILEELVRDRTAFLNGETKNWDAYRAGQKMIDAISARAGAINEWRENDWANYGGPDRQHEYDAQVCGLFFEKEAEKHQAKSSEYRAIEEFLHGAKRKWLPEGMQKITHNNDTVFKISNDSSVTTQDGKRVSILGVKENNGEIEIILRDKNDNLTLNKVTAELMVDKLLSSIGDSGTRQRLQNDPLARAELLARYLQKQSVRELDTFFQASELGAPKNGKLPPSLRSAHLDWEDVRNHVLNRLPQNMAGHEKLIAQELASLREIGNQKLNDAIEEYKQNIIDYRLPAAKLLLSDLEAGRLPLGVPVEEYIQEKKAEYDRVSANFGQSKNAAEITAVYEKVKKIDIANLETRRKKLIESLSNRGFDTNTLNSQRIFNFQQMEQALILVAPGKKLEAAAGEKLAAPLPFMDPNRTALKTNGQDLNLAARPKVESIIAGARDQLERGQIQHHHDLEAKVAAEYLRSALNSNSINSDLDLYVGGRRAIDPGSGKIFTTGMGIQFGQNQENYQKKFADLIGQNQNLDIKATIDGKEIFFGKLSYRENQDGTKTLEYRAGSDIADKARIEHRKEMLFQDLKQLKDQADGPEKLRLTIRKIAELEWLSTQGADYWKGSEDLAQMRSRALLDAGGVENGKFKAGINPALEAMTSSLSDFVRNYENFFEKTPVLFPKDYAAKNDFSKAYSKSISSPDSGKTMEDGSTFYELKEPKKVKIFGIEQTIIGVENKDGRVAVVTTDKAGKRLNDSTLTDVHVSQMLTSMRTKPLAQGVLQSDSKLAANVLVRVLESSSTESVEERVRLHQANTNDTGRRFQAGFYRNDELARIEKRTLDNLKEALTARQFQTFRDVIHGLDTTENLPLESGSKPSSEFENVMNALKKECAIAGLNITFKTNPDGNGEVRLKKGALEFVVNTDDANKFTATRNGVALKFADGVDAFGDMAESLIHDLHTKLVNTPKPPVGSTIELPGADLKPTKYVVLTHDGNTMQVKEVKAEGPTPPPIRAGKVTNGILNSPDYYRPFVNPTEPEKKFVIDRRNSRTYELGARNPLTWEVEIFERPDISSRSSEFIQRHLLKTAHETYERTVQSAQESARPFKPSHESTQVISQEKMRLFIERVGADAHDNATSVFARAKEFYLQEGNKNLEAAVRRTKFIEDPTLKSGQSRLVFTENGKEFQPKSFNSSGENGSFETLEGRQLSLKDCRMEVRMGKGTEGKDAVREALKCFQQLKLELTLTDAANAEIQRKQMRENMELQHQEFMSQKPSAIETNAQGIVARIGAFEVAGNAVEVFLTDAGIRIGGVEKNNSDLIEEAIKSKREQIKNAKSDQVEKLKLEVKELENLHRDIRDGKKVELEKMRTAIVENIRSEFEARQSPAAGRVPPKGIATRAAETTGRAGAYLMISAFVASMMTNESYRQPSTLKHTPFTPLSSKDKK